MTNASPTLASFRGRGPGLKLIGIVVLTFLLALPLFLIQTVVDDRRESAAAAASSVAQGWGGAQELAGPFLVVPYARAETRDGKGNLLEAARRGTVVLSPDLFDADVTAKTQIRSRGIYDVPVYEAELHLVGAFDLSRLQQVNDPAIIFAFDQAYLAIALSDPRGMTASPVVTLHNGTTGVPMQAGLRFVPGSGIDSWVSGMHLNLPLIIPNERFKVDIRFGLRGLNTLQLIPVGDTTRAKITADWPHPSFNGSFLPVERAISATGFTASWEIPALARALPQVFFEPGGGYLMSGSGFGVQFYEPVDLYHSVERALKYAVLFIGLAFLAFFLVETLTAARIHIVQYLLVGSAQVVFYLLLLALAEQAGFAEAYLAATLASVALTSLYAGSIFGSWGKGLVLFCTLGSLYGLLFAILDQEDYALLAGSAVLFVALALTMFLTRKIDWYQVATLPVAGVPPESNDRG